MSRASDLLRNLNEEPEEHKWATAGPRRDKSHDNRAINGAAKDAIKPLALLERFYAEGKISHGHIDDR